MLGSPLLQEIYLVAVPDEKGLDGRVTDSVAYFSIPLSVSVKNLEKAILLVFVATPDGKQGEKVTLSISSPKYPNKPLLSRGVVLSDRGHWEHIDISEQVREWAQAESENYGLVLAAMLNGENLVQLGTKAQEAAMREAVMIGDMIKRPHRVSVLVTVSGCVPRTIQNHVETVPSIFSRPYLGSATLCFHES